jgi:hypothetical protein
MWHNRAIRPNSENEEVSLGLEAGVRARQARRRLQQSVQHVNITTCVLGDPLNCPQTVTVDAHNEPCKDLSQTDLNKRWSGAGADLRLPAPIFGKRNRVC